MLGNGVSMLLGPALVRYSSNSSTNETNLGQDGSNDIHARWMSNTQNDGTDKVRASSTIPTYRPGRRIPRTVQMEQMEELLSGKCTRRGSTTIWRSLLQSQVQLSLSHDPPFLPGVIFLSFLSHESPDRGSLSSRCYLCCLTHLLSIETIATSSAIFSCWKDRVPSRWWSFIGLFDDFEAWRANWLFLLSNPNHFDASR